MKFVSGALDLRIDGREIGIPISLQPEIVEGVKIPGQAAHAFVEVARAEIKRERSR